MLKPLLKISHRTMVVTMETLAVVALLLALLIGVLMWKVSKGPVSIGWAKDYVEEALSNSDEDLEVKFNDMVFSWPELNGPFRLDLSGLRVRKGKSEANTLSIDSASVGLSRSALLIGLVRPVSVIINAPSLELVRGKDGHMSLFFHGDKAGQEPEREPQGRAGAGEEVAQLFKDMANRDRSRFLSRLRAFEVRSASVAVRDYKFGLSWYLTGLNFAMKRHPEGVSVSIRAPLPGGLKEGAMIAMDLVYRKASDDFRGQGKIRDVNPYILSRFLPVPDIFAGQDLYFTGDIEAALDTNLMPTFFKVNGAIPEGRINLPDTFDAPVEMKNMHLETVFSDKDDMLAINDLSGEIGGVAFKGAGKASITDNAIKMPIKMSVAEADVSKIPSMFPKSEQDGQAYKWLAREITKGTFRNVTLDMELTGEKTRNEQLQRDEWNVHLPAMKLAFEFTDADVRYHDTLMPATNASGRGLLDLGEEFLEIEGGTAMIGEMRGENIRVKVTDLMTPGAGFVTVNTDIKGPMATALEYIAAQPIGMSKERIGLDPAKVKGTVAASVEVALPTVKDVPKDDVKVSIKGTLADLNVPEIVNGLTLSGGPLDLATEEGGFRVMGSAQLAGRDVTLDWRQYFESEGNPYSMQIKAKIGADHELRSKFGVNLDDYISGTMPVDVVYTNKGNGTSTVEVTGDLNPIRIYIDPFKFEKPAGTSGSLSATAHLKGDTIKQLSDVEVKSRDFNVSDATINFAPMNGKSADLSSGTIPAVTIGRTKAKLSFDVRDNVMSVKADASQFDLMPFLGGTEASDMYSHAPLKEKKQPMKITLNSSLMLAKNEQKLTNTKSYLELDEEGDITRFEYDARLGKKGALFVRFRPDTNGKRTFRLQTNDAGSMLHAFGVYDNVIGGNLVIYGEPKGGNNTGDLYGSMRMENFRVVRAPALASLLSLMSLSGVSQLLGNQGLVFSKLESGFEWRFRPEGNLLIIKDGKTSGNSIGLTFSGVLDRGKKTTDIAGTIIPITGINTFLSKVPLVGEILGGASGLIAATYSMKGPTSDPKVSVNPLSVLAPGIIRRILFEGGYESKIPDDAEVPADAPRAPANPPKKQAAPAKTNGVDGDA